MSYQEKNITVSLVSHIFIMIYYLANLLPIMKTGNWESGKLYALWMIVIGVNIIVNILASILTNIVLTIFESIRDGKYQEPSYIADERDQLIELKGIRFSYITFSVGMLVSVLAYISGQHPLMMISAMAFFSILAEIVGDIAQITLYRRGV
jgi:hypothetical protein